MSLMMEVLLNWGLSYARPAQENGLPGAFRM
jgi:hypothetical protein